jgi:hypothetical protein
MGRIIVALLESTIFVSRHTIVKIFSIIRVRVWKYFVFLSIEFMIQLSTRHISSFIKLTWNIYIWKRTHYWPIFIFSCLLRSEFLWDLYQLWLRGTRRDQAFTPGQGKDSSSIISSYHHMYSAIISSHHTECSKKFDSAKKVPNTSMTNWMFNEIWYR